MVVGVLVIGAGAEGGKSASSHHHGMYMDEHASPSPPPPTPDPATPSFLFAHGRIALLFSPFATFLFIHIYHINYSHMYFTLWL